jgi:hypothetical protein
MHFKCSLSGVSQWSLCNAKQLGSSLHFLHSAGQFKLASFLRLKITGGGNDMLRALDTGSDLDKLLGFLEEIRFCENNATSLSISKSSAAGVSSNIFTFSSP